MVEKMSEVPDDSDASGDLVAGVSQQSLVEHLLSGPDWDDEMMAAISTRAKALSHDDVF